LHYFVATNPNAVTEERRCELLTQHFSQYITDHKKDFVERVLNERTRYLTVVLEDIYQSQNASAVVRTCECMGLQDLHVIENKSEYTVNRHVIKGANKWIDIIRYKSREENNAEVCLSALKARGYRILATDPGGSQTIDEVELDRPLALVMGNELHGVSEFAAGLCDGKVRIPMYGFTESMNISVSAAICLNTLIPKLHKSHNPWHLTAQEKGLLRLQWYKKIVRRSDLIEREFLRSIQ